MKNAVVRLRVIPRVRRLMRRRGYRVLLLGMLGAFALWRTVNAPRTVSVRPAIVLPRSSQIGLTPVHAHWQLVPVREVFEDLSKQVRMPFAVDWETLKNSGIDPETRVKLQTNPDAPISLESALLRLGLPGLAADFTSRPIFISTTDGVNDPRRFVRTIYPVADLVRLTTPSVPSLDSGNRRDNLMRLLKEVVSPHMWVDSGGVARISEYEETLIVDATPAMHEQVSQLLAALRKR